MNIVFSTKTLFYIILLGLILVVTALLLTLKIVPDMVTSKLWEMKVLKKGTDQWDMFMEVPFPFTFKVYLFDVQNVEAILQGAKPVVKEAGPYVYKTFRWRSEVAWDENDDISFNEYMRFEFDKDASGKCKEEDEVTVINSAYNGLLLMAESISPDALPTLNSALPAVFGDLNGIFIKVKVRDLLFDGMGVCKEGGKQGGFASKMICSQMISKVPETKPMWMENNTVMMANFRYKNNTHLGRFTIKSGLGIKEDAGKLIKYDGQEYLTAWKGEKSLCNKVRGLTTSFPPNIKPEMKFDVFGEDVCRVITMDFKRTEIVKGITGYRFGAMNNSFDAPKAGTDNDCFCVNQSRTLDGGFGCTSDGLVDLTTCLGAPALMSFPHFLYGDKKYLNSIEGLQPKGEDHETFLVLEPISGTPLKMAKRIQMNMFIRPIDGITETENITHAVIPLMWLEESMTLSDKYINMLKDTLLKTLDIVNIIKWALLIVGGLAIIVPFFLIIYKQ